MTTIAWDGKTLAGDTQATRASLRNYCESKVFRITTNEGAHVLLGCSGGEAESMQIVEWLKADRAEMLKPKLDADSFTGILVDKSGVYRLDSRLHPLKLMEAFHAVGNGRDFAIAAMHLGCSAREAVELAAVYDVFTGGPITEVTLDD